MVATEAEAMRRYRDPSLKKIYTKMLEKKMEKYGMTHLLRESVRNLLYLNTFMAFGVVCFRTWFADDGKEPLYGTRNNDIVKQMTGTTVDSFAYPGMDYFDVKEKQWVTLQVDDLPEIKIITDYII